MNSSDAVRSRDDPAVLRGARRRRGSASPPSSSACRFVGSTASGRRREPASDGGARGGDVGQRARRATPARRRRPTIDPTHAPAAATPASSAAVRIARDALTKKARSPARARGSGRAGHRRGTPTRADSVVQQEPCGPGRPPPRAPRRHVAEHAVASADRHARASVTASAPARLDPGRVDHVDAHGGGAPLSANRAGSGVRAPKKRSRARRAAKDRRRRRRLAHLSRRLTVAEVASHCERPQEDAMTHADKEKDLARAARGCVERRRACFAFCLKTTAEARSGSSPRDVKICERYRSCRDR